MKELVLFHAEQSELPKISLKGVIFTLEPNPLEKSQTAILSQHKGDTLVTPKPVRRPVVLFNKEDPKPVKPLVLESKKVLPDLAFYRWHHGFRHISGKYAKVTVLKVELEYPDNLHDLLVTRKILLTLKTSLMSWQAKSKVLDHKSLAEFVIVEEDRMAQKEANFLLEVRADFEAPDLENFAIDLGQFVIGNQWLRHEFAHVKSCNGIKQ